MYRVAQTQAPVDLQRGDTAALGDDTFVIPSGFVSLLMASIITHASGATSG
jgi:hypothetical protein